MLDFHLNFRGKIAVKIGSRLKIGNKPDLTVKLFIKEFKVPIRLCFTPFSLGKCYASLLDKPKLTIDFNVKVGRIELTKIPLVMLLIFLVYMVYQGLCCDKDQEEIFMAEADDFKFAFYFQVSFGIGN